MGGYYYGGDWYFQRDENGDPNYTMPTYTPTSSYYEPCSWPYYDGGCSERSQYDSAIDMALSTVWFVMLFLFLARSIFLVFCRDIAAIKLERTRQLEIDEVMATSVQVWTSAMSDSECNICLEPFVSDEGEKEGK